MKSATQLLNYFTDKTQNTSAANQTRGLELLQDSQRILLEDYFDNERQYTTTTVGSMDLTLTAAPVTGDTSATLSSAWTYPTGTQGVDFTNSTGDVRQVLFTNGSTAVSWSGGLASDCTSTTIATQGFQKYKIPAQISKITNSTVYVGQLRFVPAPVNTRSDWDRLNFLPYSADFPNYYFIYNGYLEFSPIPSTTGNLITFNYKTRVPEFSFLFKNGNAAWTAGSTPTDYTQGTISGTLGSTTITGSGTSWTSWSGGGGFPVTPLGQDILYWYLGLKVNPPYGDGFVYPITYFGSDTSLTLLSPIQNAPNISGATYSIGQYPLLTEDFHDAIVFGALKVYFSSIVPDANRFKEFDELYQTRVHQLSRYAGQKQVSYNLGEDPVQLVTPTLYPFYPNGVNN